MANTKLTTKSKATGKSVASLTKHNVARPAKKTSVGSSVTTSKRNNKKSNNGIIAGIILAVALIVIGAIVALSCFKKPDPSDPTANLDYSTSFFVYNDGTYSLWNADGRRLTEDEYQTQSNFLAGHAMVKKDDEYGIIDERGRMTVDYGKYSTIYSEGGLYLARAKESDEDHLITSSGQILEKGTNLQVNSPSDSAGFTTVITEDKIKAYNHTGKLIFEAEKIADEEEPGINSLRDYGIVHYGDKNWLFDARNGNLLATFDGERYSFDTVSEDRSMILLSDYENSEKYKLFANGQLHDLDETKYYGLTEDNQVIGYDNYEELALLGDDYKVAKTASIYIQFKDANNYAEEKKDGGVVIYQNGQVVKEFDDNAGIPVSGLLYNDYYAISDGEKIKFYNLDGTLAFDKEFRDVNLLSDENHHAIVSETEGEYYLMDARGNRVGDVTGTEIVASEGGYKVENSDGKFAILDKNGKKITDFKYIDLYYRSIAEPRNIWTARLEGGNVDVVDVDNNRILLENVPLDGFYENYFTVRKEDGSIDYYTLNGNKFYTKTSS